MKICFWGNIARAINGRTSGGGELQMSLLASALAKSGHEVVILDYEINEEFTTDEGIRVLPIKSWDKGIRFIRTITHRIPQLYSCLKEQKADIYYCRIRDSRHFLAWLAARKLKAKFIMGLAEDLDIMSFKMRFKHHYLTDLATLWGVVDGILIELIYPRLIRKSDFVFAQHKGQKQILIEKGIKSVLFPNLIDKSKLPAAVATSHEYFIFVGWLDKHKGIEEFFRLVEMAPSSNFIVIGPPRDKTGHFYYEKLKSFKNVTLMGELNHIETLNLIANSKALISTSHMEGFPNIFIEAWVYGIPVLSLYVDPGSVIEEHRLGTVAHGDLNKLLEALMANNNTDEFTARANNYVEQYHSLNSAKIEAIGRMFNDLMTTGKYPDSILDKPGASKTLQKT